MSKKLFAIIFSFIVCSILMVARLEAGTVFQLDFTSRYIWRGFDLNPPNKPALQPSVTYSFGDSGFSVNLWGSFSFENSEVNELDFTLSYEFKISNHVSMSLGFTHYGWYFAEPFRFEDHTTQELYVSAGFPGMFLSPVITFYYDFTNGNGFYLLLGAGYSQPLSDNLSLNLRASLGYNGGQWIESHGFSDLNFGVSLPFKIKKLTLSPFFHITFVLLEEVNPGVDNEIIFGVSLAF